MDAPQRVQRRREAGFHTQAALASAAHVPPGYVGHWDRGRKISDQAVEAIESVLMEAERKAEVLRENKARWDRHQALAAKLPACPEVQDYLQAMKMHAIELLACGDAEECDALVEFMPPGTEEDVWDTLFPEHS